MNKFNLSYVSGLSFIALDALTDIPCIYKNYFTAVIGDEVKLFAWVENSNGLENIAVVTWEWYNSTDPDKPVFYVGQNLNTGAYAFNVLVVYDPENDTWQTFPYKGASDFFTWQQDENWSYAS